MDLRLPIGSLFLLFGSIVGIWGIFTPRSLYKASLGININADWGVVMVVFGVAMLAFALRAREEEGAAVKKSI